MPDRSDPPQYTKYRAGRRPFRRGKSDEQPSLEALREPPGRAGEDRGPRRTYGRRRRPALSGGRFFRWLALALFGWIALSLALFLVSAQLRQGDIDDSGLGGGGFPLTSPTTVLVLGSDTRTERTREPGAPTSGRGRSDSILLMRVGGGKSARLSIPRDTLVEIPGSGRQKINAAFAIGGAPLAVQTIEAFLGLEINHLVQVDFEGFGDLVDAMGGVDYTGGCVVSRINGGFANGGFTLRLPKGTSHIDGRQALALARTRKNECNKREDDLTRARRQQKLFSAMKSRLLSPGAFVRLPVIAWNAPKALSSDMSGPTLLGLFGAVTTSSSPKTRVLRPSGVEGGGLVVDETRKEQAVRRFLAG